LPCYEKQNEEHRISKFYVPSTVRRVIWKKNSLCVCFYRGQRNIDFSTHEFESTMADIEIRESQLQ